MTEPHDFRREIGYSLAHSVNDLPLQERVRQRFKALVDAKGVPHEVLAEYLGLSRSGVTRLLNDDGSGFALHHIEKLCEFFQITASEAVADQHALIQAIKPMEAALLDVFRHMTELERRSLMTVLERPIASQERRNKRSRLGRAMLTAKEQELVDLFARVKRDGVREGVLRTLKGAAQDAPAKDRTPG